MTVLRIFFFFFSNDTATTEIYTLSLHDALPILPICNLQSAICNFLSRNSDSCPGQRLRLTRTTDRKSTRLNSSHQIISYAVFCLKKKKNRKILSSHPTPCSARCITNPSAHTTHT